MIKLFAVVQFRFPKEIEYASESPGCYQRDETRESQSRQEFDGSFKWSVVKFQAARGVAAATPYQRCWHPATIPRRAMHHPTLRSPQGVRVASGRDRTGHWPAAAASRFPEP